MFVVTVRRIIVLRPGQIIEEGNHDALITRGGHYAELYNTYFRHQSLEFIDRKQNQRARSGAAQPPHVCVSSTGDAGAMGGEGRGNRART